MSPERHPSPRAAAVDPRRVGVLALGLPDGTRLEDHVHAWPQLVYASHGVLTVRTDEGTWILPPRRAVWVPAGLLHSLEATGEVRLRTLYLHPEAAAGLPERAAVMDVAPLLRELVLEIVRRGGLTDETPDQERLLGVLRDLLVATPEAPFELAWPRDPRARRVAERLHRRPRLDLDHAALAAHSGASERTLERLFRRETGETLGAWRRRSRLFHALRLLAAGTSVSETAWEVGYATPSAFIAAFRRTLGRTPGEFLARPEPTP